MADVCYNVVYFNSGALPQKQPHDPQPPDRGCVPETGGVLVQDRFLFRAKSHTYRKSWSTMAHACHAKLSTRKPIAVFTDSPSLDSSVGGIPKELTIRFFAPRRSEASFRRARASERVRSKDGSLLRLKKVGFQMFSSCRSELCEFFLQMSSGLYPDREVWTRTYGGVGPESFGGVGGLTNS